MYISPLVSLKSGFDSADMMGDSVSRNSYITQEITNDLTITQSKDGQLQQIREVDEDQLSIISKSDVDQTNIKRHRSNSLPDD